jgi:hypothetical protein
VPTSIVTRVTSLANELSCSTMVLTVLLRSSISPSTSTSTILLRSPAATALVTLEIERTCFVRLLAMTLTFLVRSAHVPCTPGTVACPPKMARVPTSIAMRVTSEENDESCCTIVLTVSLSSSISPRTSTSTIWLRSPAATALVTFEMDRTWFVRLLAMVYQLISSISVNAANGRTLTLLVNSAHVPCTPYTVA